MSSHRPMNKALRDHSVAVFKDGEYMGKVTAKECSIGLKINQTKVFSMMKSHKPSNGFRLVDLEEDDTHDVCPGCILTCHQPWPCNAALRNFTSMHRHDKGDRPIFFEELIG